MLYSKRLRLRFVEDKDSELIMKLRNAKEIKQYFYSDDPIATYTHQAFMEKSRGKGDKYFTIELIEDGTVIGFIGLTNIDYVHRKAEYGWLLLDPQFRGKKFGDEAELLIHTYAFDTLNLNKVTGEVLSGNELVIKQHERNGYKVTGIFKNHIYKNGKYHDVVWIEIFKQDFEEIKNSERYRQFI
jgi:UDP-4-amino-4,6-dideoxy-N-acetyl-beta-L-altrosamine N-acetyltransferase